MLLAREKKIRANESGFGQRERKSEDKEVMQPEARPRKKKPKHPTPSGC